MANHGLLKKFDECVYPGDFLVARLHGKNGGLFRNWEFLIADNNPIEQLHDTVFYSFLKKYGAEGIWRFLRNEHVWIYKRMNRNLRNTFEPYFIYHEIGTLIKTIRHIHSKKEKEIIAQQIHNSLLNNDIQEILVSGRDFPVILSRLESCFVSGPDFLYGLREHYEKKGFIGLEIFLREKLFSFILFQCQSPMLKIFFRHIVDFHNCMTLAKNIRWETAGKHVYLSGGIIEPEKFLRSYTRKDLETVLKIFSIPGTAAEITSVAQLEKVLLSLITKVLRRWSYQRTMVGEILYYLWEQYRYTKNISMVLCTMRLKDEMVRENIIA